MDLLLTHSLVLRPSDGLWLVHQCKSFWKTFKENKVTTKEKLTAVVRIIETRLESNEKETRDLENQMIEEIEKIDEKIDQINSNLDDIENKNTKMDQRFRIVLYNFWSTLKL